MLRIWFQRLLAALLGVTAAFVLFAPSVAVKPAASGSLSTLGNLCSIAVLGFLGAGLAHFLEIAQGRGMIFRAWRCWAARVFWFRGRARLVGPFGFGKGNHTNGWIFKPNSGSYYRTKPDVRQALYKILGGCIYCASVWVGSFFYAWGAAVSAAPFWLIVWGWPLFVGAQTAFIELIFTWQPQPQK